MSTDNTGAYQEMAARIRSVVIGDEIAAIVGYVPELRYADTAASAALPKGDKLWLRFTMAKAAELRRTLGRPALVTYTGIASVQLFVPISDPKAAERIRRVAEKVKSAYAVSTANVDFYKAGIDDQPPDATWLLKRISATFQYSQRQG